MKQFIAKFPQPPTSNKIYMSRKGGGRYLSAEAKAYREEQILRFGCLSEPMFPKPCLLTVKYYWFPLDKRIRDWDNIIKLLQDTLNFTKITKTRKVKLGVGIWEDDHQIIDPDPFVHLPDPDKKGCVYVHVCECSKKQLLLADFEKMMEFD